MNTYSNMTGYKEQDHSWVIDKICDRVITVIYNELDYYMFEELGYTETDDKYVEDADELIAKIINQLTK